MDLDYNLKNWSSISKFFPCVCVGKSMKTDFGSAKRQRNEEQNNGQRHKKNNGDGGYLGPVKIELRKGTGVLAISFRCVSRLIFFSTFLKAIQRPQESIRCTIQTSVAKWWA